MSIIKSKQVDVNSDFNFQNHKLINLSSPLSNTDAANKLYVDNSSIKSGGTINGDILIKGDLYISGITTTIDVANLNIRDNILLLNSGETSDHVTLIYSGIEVSRGTSTNYRFVFNDNADAFQIGLIGNLQSVATRQDAPSNSGISYWNSTSSRFDTSPKLTYNGIDLYVSGMTNSVSDYVVYYDTNTGKLTYGIKPQGSGFPGGVNTSVQFNSGGTLSGNTNLLYDGKDLIISGMTPTVTEEVVYYDSVTGKLTYGAKPAGGGEDYISTGSTTFDITSGTVINRYSVTKEYIVYHYRINSGNTNLRAGTITIVNNSSSSEIIDVTTSDIGDTSDVTFTSVINGTNVELTAISTSNGWSIKYIRIVTFDTTPTGDRNYILSGTTTFDVTASSVIDTYPTSKEYVYYQYRINSGNTNLRAGTITIVNNSSTSEIIDIATSDIGSTTGVSFTSNVNGSNVELNVTSISSGWSIKYIKIIS